ncbi:putative AraC family transcriptional regulator [Gordonia effusa NBRC 100432]|uniref:Putative AraC family transcriptional regulator n=1 Tax=Gordonia effusa NBRC 100432 TaxID=1077974 RepID=H0R208_9ACTN|nr:helix-turn-helix domain-containing protein [Gordonia effusa]GAB19113.1 putative AraC family transcriptional regulator [Gordonia effusa NBRC 100432]
MRIAIYVFEGASLFHIAAPLAVFGEVGRVVRDIEWSTVLWSFGGQAVRTAEGNTLSGVAGPEVIDDADIFVIPTWPMDLPAADAGLCAALRAAHERGAVIVGLCLGATAIIDAGLLDGRAAVTHWGWIPQLTQRNPNVVLDTSVLYIDHGDVITSAGTAASIDACLHIVRRYLGASAANQVARYLVVAPHRDGGQAQYIERPVAPQPDGDPIGEVCEWALANLDGDLSVDVLAAQANMSRRSFVRNFRAATGTPPAQWVTDQRLDESRVLLENTRWGMDRIAHACGFGSAVTFRQNFVRRYTTTPSAYRARFGVSGDAEAG